VTSAALASDAGGAASRLPPDAVRSRMDDRLPPAASRDPLALSLAILIGSIALHATLLALALSGRSPLPPVEREITVDLVPDLPKPPVSKPPVTKAPVPKPSAPSQAKQASAEPAKPPPAPKAEPAKKEPAKLESAKPEIRAPASQDPQKPAIPKAAQANPTPVNPPEAPRSSIERRAPPPPSPPPSSSPSSPSPSSSPQQAAAEADQLRQELAALRAEQQALREAAATPPGEGAGPLAASHAAIALPSIAGADGEEYAYQDLVFSQLAKAKGLDGYKGRPGTTGVRFEIDAAGQLVSASVVATSGDAALDARALDIIRRAAPFPAPPKDAERSFFANVNFVPPKS
jgi:TonB family protein